MEVVEKEEVKLDVKEQQGEEEQRKHGLNRGQVSQPFHGLFMSGLKFVLVPSVIADRCVVFSWSVRGPSVVGCPFVVRSPSAVRSLSRILPVRNCRVATRSHLPN